MMALQGGARIVSICLAV